MATFCEKTMQEADNVLSILRVVDRLNVNAAGPDPPKDMPPVPMGLTGVVILRRGDARGRYVVKVRAEDPSGLQRESVDVSVQLGGDPESGANIVIDFSQFALDLEGLWWFDVLFGDSETLLSRIPLRVVYAPQRLAQPE
jgi:hypothetical protein